MTTLALTQLVLALLVSLPPSVTDTNEPPDARRARLEVAAYAVSSAATRATCDGVEGPCRPIWRGDARHAAAALLAIGWHESRYAAYVGQGRCADGPPDARCDPHHKTGVPLARSYWQLHRATCRDLWELRPGSPEAVQVAAWCAIRHLAGARTECRKDAARAGFDELSGAFSGYGGRGCTRASAKARTETAARLLARLRLPERLLVPNDLGAVQADARSP